jgi:hypothetical protein
MRLKKRERQVKEENGQLVLYYDDGEKPLKHEEPKQEDGKGN